MRLATFPFFDFDIPFLFILSPSRNLSRYDSQVGYCSWAKLVQGAT